jgi:hypothetical protein
MKLKLGNSIVLSMVAMLFLSMMTILPVHAVTPSLYMTPSVNPPTASPSIGYKWNITVYGKNFTDVYSWQVALVYNSTLINCTNAWCTSDEMAIWGTAPSTSFAVGKVMAADTKKGGGSGWTGDGPIDLAIFEFQILKAPGKYTTLSCTINMDNSSTYLLDHNLAKITRTATDGSYSWAWTAPPPARVGVKILAATGSGDKFTCTIVSVENPAEVIYWNSSTAVCNNITVGVYLKQYTDLWGVTLVNFTICYNSTLLNIVWPVVPNPLWTTFTNATAEPPGQLDQLIVTVNDPSNEPPSGDVLLATVIFHVKYQDTYPKVDMSPLDINTQYAEDHIGPITLNPPYNGEVIIQGKRLAPFPWFEVSSVTLGPDLVIGTQYGKEFNITIDIKGLEAVWLMVGVQFRLAYDPTLMKVVKVTEGPFLQDPRWDWYGTYPIVFPAEPPISPPNGVPSTNALLGDILLPNHHGIWDQTQSPHGNGTLWIITFKALKQSWTDTYTADLILYQDHLANWLTNQKLQAIPVNPQVPGKYTVLPIAPVGRRIDLWMLNPPLGGEGPGAPADLVLPQTEITLTAKVTYNWQPVSYKKVTFEIRGPRNTLWAVLQNDTQDDGHATVVFRMPWTGQGAEANLGKWHVNASVTLADVVITDYMDFDYDYLIHIWSVTTDKLEYYKCNYTTITVNYGTKSKRMQTVTMYATIQDNLGVPIGLASLTKTVGGGAYCHYKNFTDTVVIHVPTWAYAGKATVRVSFVDALPSQDGEAVAQERTATIYILPVESIDPWFQDP